LGEDEPILVAGDQEDHISIAKFASRCIDVILKNESLLSEVCQLYFIIVAFYCFHKLKSDFYFIFLSPFAGRKDDIHEPSSRSPPTIRADGANKRRAAAERHDGRGALRGSAGHSHRCVAQRDWYYSLPVK
jgi:hypothetical protein